MDALFFHPKWVHLPLALSLLLPLLTAGITLAWWRKWLPARTWLIAVALQAVLLASGVVALRTGHADEERVEEFVAEEFIEAHEEAADAFVWSTGGVLVVMIAALFLAGRPAGVAVAAVSVAGTLAVLFLGYRVGEAGGALVYRHGAAQAYVTGGTGGDAVGEAPDAVEGNTPRAAADERDGDDDD